ncbi:IPP transferase-domain-containing protein [Dunaliella salina]|uniref:tRNA dimethylallyltransferase n=1 Tax=Dunaliella salina TaxID=3046 RepID=A0ABQ7GLP3_DUNSA|nr:IPP transferase-domain-containing protein [Dunaliella salina]|eukprot:KAF5835533.1 IPP transferase-domain-containing protein [Dunaliella salina]
MDARTHSSNTKDCKQPVIVITGPTAVGKTGVGLDVALALNGEVISADSVQVMCLLPLPAAAALAAAGLPVSERKGVPHHLIDVLDVHEDYSAGRFHDEARAVICDVVARGRTPIVVGGTGFYLRFLQEGKPKAGKTTPEVAAAMREAIQKCLAAPACAFGALVPELVSACTFGALPPQLVSTASGALVPGLVSSCAFSALMPQAWQEEALRLGIPGGPDSLSPNQKWDSAVKLLGAWGDEDAMHKIALELNNYYRLERALAVLHLTGRKRAEVDIGAQTQDSTGEEDDCASVSSSDTSQQHTRDFDFRPFFLHRNRELLHRRCNARVVDMVLGLGLLDEAAMLLSKGISSSDGSAAPGSMAGKAVGYRQAIEWMLQMTDAEAVQRDDVVELVEAICTNTHKLVRHQMTWFRDNGTYKVGCMSQGIL